MPHLRNVVFEEKESISMFATTRIHFQSLSTWSELFFLKGMHFVFKHLTRAPIIQVNKCLKEDIISILVDTSGFCINSFVCARIWFFTRCEFYRHVSDWIGMTNNSKCKTYFCHEVQIQTYFERMFRFCRWKWKIALCYWHYELPFEMIGNLRKVEC